MLTVERQDTTFGQTSGGKPLSPLFLGLTTARQILAVERSSEPAESGEVEDGQTNSVTFDTICLAVNRRSEPADSGRADEGQTKSVLFD